MSALFRQRHMRVPVKRPRKRVNRACEGTVARDEGSLWRWCRPPATGWCVSGEWGEWGEPVPSRFISILLNQAQRKLSVLSVLGRLRHLTVEASPETGTHSVGRGFGNVSVRLIAAEQHSSKHIPGGQVS